MKLYYCLTATIVALLWYTSTSNAQGCVAVRNMSACSLHADTASHHGWRLNFNYRYFKSFRHFRGNHEEKERIQNNTQVINYDNSILLGLTYDFSKRITVSAIIPYLNIERSSLYEHKGNSSGERHYTSSQGLGDIRITGYYTMQGMSGKLNVVTGLGVKLPTGDYNYMDYFHKSGSEGQDTLVLQAVDQSIQPGDGGTGLIVEFSMEYTLTRHLKVYSNNLYLFNPRNTNGTLRNRNLVNNIPLSNELSVADQFLVRLGFQYNLNNLQASFGARVEGIPVRDALGKSDGFRRPGYIVSLEPALLHSFGRHTIGINVPIALERNRTQSTLDKKRTEVTGTYQHGDAAFADIVFLISYGCRLGQ